MISESDRKLLTKFIGECWHDAVCISEVMHPRLVCECCGKKGHSPAYFPTRTFSTWEDLGKVKEKLVEVGAWIEFYKYAQKQFKESFVFLWKDVLEEEVAAWLFQPERFCHLTADYLREKKGE